MMRRFGYSKNLIQTLLNIYLWQISLFKQDSIFFGELFNMLILLYMKPNVPATSPPVLSLLKEEKNQGSIPRLGCDAHIAVAPGAACLPLLPQLASDSIRHLDYVI